MRLLALKARGFRNLPDGERVEFPAGLVFLQGPNEAGKSNLLRALKFALFRVDRRKKGARDLRLVKWGLEDDFFIELEFVSAAGRHLLRRSSAGDRDILILPSGEELKARALREELARLTGLPDERSFDATCCVFQGQLPTPTDEMRSLVERSSLGAEVDIDGLTRRIERELQELRRGLDRPAKDPGRILLAREELARARRAAADAEELERMAKDREELAREVERAKGELTDKENARDGLGRFLDAKGEEARAKDALASLHEQEGRLSSMRDKKADTEAEAEAKREDLKRVRLKLEEAERSEDRLTDLQNALARLDELRREEAGLTEHLTRLPEVSDEDVRNAESIPRELDGLQAPLRVKARPLAPDVPIELEADGRKLPEGTLETSASLAAVARVPGVAEIEVAVEGVRKEQLRKKEELRRLLEKYGVSSPDVLRSLYGDRQSRIAELKELRARREEILGDSNESSLRGEAEELRRPATAVGDLRRSVGKLEESLAVLDRESARLEGQLRGLQEQVPQKRQELIIASAEAQLRIKDLSRYAAYGAEDLSRLEREAAEAKESGGELLGKLRSLEGAIGQARRQVATAAADVESAQRKLAALERRALVYEEVREGLTGAKLRSVGSRRSAMEEAVGNYIGRFSLGRYTRCEFSDDFSVRLWSEEKRGWVAPGDGAEEMSSGLRDQLYLACRLAAAETFFKGSRPPVFLDDPLVHFDRERAAAAIDALAAFAEGFQTIVLTCHSYALPEGVTCVALPAEA